MIAGRVGVYSNCVISGAPFTSREYELYLQNPNKIESKKRLVIESWESWLAKHSHSSWYQYQVRLCSCDSCPQNRPFKDYIKQILPGLSQHKNFIPTPQMDPETQHFLPLEELMDKHYCRPDTFLPENLAAKIKATICKDCEVAHLKKITANTGYWYTKMHILTIWRILVEQIKKHQQQIQSRPFQTISRTWKLQQRNLVKKPPQQRKEVP